MREMIRKAAKNETAKGGFTLVEATVSLVIFSVFALVIYYVLNMVNFQIYGQSQRAELDANTRRLLNDMVQELREGTLSNLQVPDSTNTDSISFQIPQTVDSSGTVTAWYTIRYVLGTSSLTATASNNADVVTYTFTPSASANITRYQNGTLSNRALAANISSIQIKFDESLGKLYSIRVTGSKTDLKNRTFTSVVEMGMTQRNAA